MNEPVDNPTQPEVETAPSPTAGERLRRGREQSGWTLERLAGELCLPVDRLRALEADDFAGFGGAVFVRGYLRRAAAVLGLSPAEVIASYESVSGTARPADIVPELPPGRPPRRGLPEWTGTAAGAAAVVCAIAVTWWFMKPATTPEPLAEAPPPATAPATLDLPEAVAESAAETIPELGPAPQPDVAAVEESVAAETSGPAASTPAQEVAAAPAAQNALQAPVADTPAEEGAAALQLPVTVELRFEFDEDCWVEITDARGTRLAYRLYRAGDVSRLRGVAPIDVLLGNAEGVRLTVDDTPVAVRPASRRDGTARLTVGGGTG